MGIQKLMYELNKYTRRLNANKNTFIEKVGESPNQEDPQARRNYDVAVADRKLSDTFASSDFKVTYQAEIAQMRSVNKTRALEAPTAEMERILNVLRMIDSPDDKLMAYAAQSLKGNTLALFALNSIARKAKKAQVDIFLPLDEESTEAALDALETYCSDIAQKNPDEYLATACELNTNDTAGFVENVLHVPAKAFLAAVSRD